MRTETKQDRMERMLSSLHNEAHKTLVEIRNAICDLPACAENGATWGTVGRLAHTCDELEAIRDSLKLG